MASEGKRLGTQPRNDLEHFIRCPICGKMLDMRDLGDVMDHLHGQKIEEEPTLQ